VIRAKAAPQTGAKILGKIDLGERSQEVEEAPKPEPVKEPAKACC
jgi:translation initiation factor IF-2